MLKGKIVYSILTIVAAFTILLHADRAHAQCFLSQHDDVICAAGKSDSSSDTTNPGQTYTDPGAPPVSISPGGITPSPVTDPGNGPDLPPTLSCDGQNAYQSMKTNLAAREGCKQTVYKDSLGNPTVGCGHLVTPADNLQVGDTISQERVDQLFDQDAMKAWNQAQADAAEAGVCDPCFIAALGNANYQLGSFKTKFPDTWKLIQAGQYNDAAAALNQSAWMQQTPTRVRDFQAALRALPPKGNCQ